MPYTQSYGSEGLLKPIDKYLSSWPKQQFTKADTAVRIGRAAIFDKGTKLNFCVKIEQISLLFKMSQRLYDWLFYFESFGNF